MASVFWSKSEERLPRGAEVTTIYVSFQQVPLTEFLLRMEKEDERTGNESKIENFRTVSSIQPPKVRWHQNFGTGVVQ